MKTYKVTYDEGFGPTTTMITIDLTGTTSQEQEIKLIEGALRVQHDIDLTTNPNAEITSWETSDTIPETSYLDDPIIRMVLFNIGMAIGAHFALRWMHKHVYPKHPWMLFPFHGIYKRQLARNNADYIVPGALGPFIKPKFRKYPEKESTS